MRKIGSTLAAALGALAAGCVPAPQPQPRYLVGEPYEMGGVWSYPREDFSLTQTGLASVTADSREGRLTANGELHDPARASAAHRTLQLPAVLRVTNLETGREALLRVNDRGPSNPGRVVELSRRAAELLGLPPGGTAQVRISVEPELSRAVAARAAGGSAPVALAIEAAPRAAVHSESLAPLPGTQQAAGRPVRSDSLMVEVASAAGRRADPEPILPETVAQGAPRPGLLHVEAGTFFRRDAAARQAARLASLGARIEPFGERSAQQFRVRIGPLRNVAEADRTLERTLASGVSEARIVVD